MNPKVLVITYYWPPSGGSGVQRWVKFVKYLEDFGWEPVIYTPENPEAPAIDHSLEKEIPGEVKVLKTPIHEPYGLYKKLTGRKQVGVGFMSEREKPSLLEGIFKWIRGNLFIPDARKFWIRPSLRFLSEYLQSHSIDVIASTGPPHSMHLIAKEISDRFDLPWLADFRDPWTNIDYYDELMLTPWADRKHHRLEREVLTLADRVCVVSPTMKKEMESKSGRPVDLLTNGFDREDYRDSPGKLDEKFSITHIGSMVETRNPYNLWEVLQKRVESSRAFKKALEIKLVGKVDISILETIQRYQLDPYLNKIDYLPHDEVTTLQQKSRILLLVLNDTPNAKGLLPGKLFEYLAARRPIIAVGPEDADVATVMEKSASYLLTDLDKTERLDSFIGSEFKKYKNRNRDPVRAEIDQYSRSELTGKLTSILNDMIS